MLKKESKTEINIYRNKEFNKKIMRNRNKELIKKLNKII
jgi:hypothetical protein